MLSPCNFSVISRFSTLSVTYNPVNAGLENIRKVCKGVNPSTAAFAPGDKSGSNSARRGAINVAAVNPNSGNIRTPNVGTPYWDLTSSSTSCWE